MIWLDSAKDKPVSYGRNANLIRPNLKPTNNALREWKEDTQVSEQDENQSEVELGWKRAGPLHLSNQDLTASFMQAKP